MCTVYKQMHCKISPLYPNEHIQMAKTRKSRNMWHWQKLRDAQNTSFAFDSAIFPIAELRTINNLSARHYFS